MSRVRDRLTGASRELACPSRRHAARVLLPHVCGGCMRTHAKQYEDTYVAAYLPSHTCLRIPAFAYYMWRLHEDTYKAVRGHIRSSIAAFAYLPSHTCLRILYVAVA